MAKQKNTPKTKPLTLPESETRLWLNFLGLGCSFLALALLRRFWPDVDIMSASLIAMAAAAVPIILIEVAYYRVQDKASTGLSSSTSAVREVDPERVAVKLIGLVGTFGYLAILYWALPEYDKNFFDRYWMLLSYALPLLLAAAVPYFWWMDARLKDPEDSYYHFGLTVLLQWREVDKKRIGPHLRDWLVKGFFFPLMFLYIGGNTLQIIQYDFGNWYHYGEFQFGRFFDYANNFLFFMDLLFAAVGYAITFRYLDTHIRSSEPTFRGWVVAVMCYSPFWQAVFYGSYFAYDDDYYWGHMLGAYPGPYMVWGTAILCLLFVYATATVSLGIRFSNLTYRGLVTNGFYRFTKHPAYVSKNLSWWLVSVPFISSAGPAEAIRHSLLLLGVNVIYYLRARTEEQHLSNYPEYVAYGNYMNEHSIFAPLARVLPFLKYQAPAGKE